MYVNIHLLSEYIKKFELFKMPTDSQYNHGISIYKATMFFFTQYLTQILNKEDKQIQQVKFIHFYQ